MFIVEKKPKSVSAEAYKSLRTNLQYSSFDKEYRTIVVTSSEPGEGKSTTAGNLAIVLAQGEANVLLVDCDMRKPTLHKRFKMSNTKGLSDLLVSKSNLGSEVDKIVQKYSNNLSVITAGKIPPNPSEMLGSKSMERFLEDMKGIYDYIVLDTPPVQAVTDAQILARKVDGVLLVIRANKTKKEVVNNSVNAINNINGNLIGIVLNGVDTTSQKYYHYYEEEGKK